METEKACKRLTSTLDEGLRKIPGDAKENKIPVFFS
jgi:hypothetical protein